MTNKDYRRLLVKKYSCHYHSLNPYRGHRRKCAYCGMDAQCDDHVPPLHLLEGMNVIEYKKKGGECIIYPACLECNRLLGGHPAVDLYDRLDILSRKYQKKIDRLEVWTENELKQMGRTLRNFIESHQHKIKIWLLKLEALEDKKLSIELKDAGEEQ